MMRTYRILALLLLVTMLLPFLFACGVADEPVQTTSPGNSEPAVTEQFATESDETEPPETTVEATEPAPPVFRNYTATETNDYVKLIGRTRLYRGGFLADWTATGIEFEYEGSGNLEFVIERDSGKNVTLIAEVDGETKTVTVDQNGTKTYRVATDLSDGAHHVMIRRRTMVEDQDGKMFVMIKGINLCGTFKPKPADNKYMIAFLGDSITCGQGLPNGDGLATFAVDFCTREKFDYDICCVSGFGVDTSSTRHGFSENTMTKYYPFQNYYRSTTLRYTPERKADLVIVNLNTNDNNFGATEAPYKESLKTLISEIREAHGEDVKIVWIVGMMISPDANVNKWMNAVFDELGGESAGLYRILVETNTSGMYSHPDASSHAAVSQALSQYIRDKRLLEVSARIPK